MFEVIAAALQGGAETIVLCDTNGGCLPNEIFSLTWQIVQALHVTGQEVPIGIRACNDSACAVANSLEAVRAGATLVQGTVNGYGERAGACNLLSLIANLQLKLGYQLISSEQLSQLTQTAQFVAETFNVALDVGTPYVGKSAFACKGGRHVGAEMRSQGIHAHVDPASVGNFAHVVLSDLTSKAALFAKSQGYGFSLKSVAALDSLFECINQREAAGYSYEVADASLELLLKTQLNEPVRHFTLESFRVISEHHAHGESTTEATVKVHVNTKVGPVRFIATSEGNDPVRALDAALRKAITRFYPQVTKFELCDYKVRLIDGGAGTGATMRALIETTDGQHNWSTVGVSENLIEASWDALVDSIAYGLLKGAAR
jgi:2-isopropylmalate synthase